MAMIGLSPTENTPAGVALEYLRFQLQLRELGELPDSASIALEGLQAQKSMEFE